MKQSGGGQICTKLAKSPDGGEDRLSALPDELLVLILECLDTTAEAARTSVLARRWRSLWPVLSKLNFQLHPDGNRIRELLDIPDAPELCYISVTTEEDSVTAWLTAAARRLTGGLVYHIKDYMDNYDEKAKRGGNDVQLPCFDKATMIELGGLSGLVLPSVGVFTRLTHLSLSCVDLCVPCELANVVSSLRCPCLQKLSIYFVSRLRDLSIHTESLLQMELKGYNLSQLTVVTPILQKLTVHGIAPDISGHPSEPVANITAPQIVSLEWMGSYDPRYFHLGNLGQLWELQTSSFLVYGTEFQRESNHHCLRLLQRFQVLHSLHLILIYYQRLLGWATVLRKLRITFLDEMADGEIEELSEALAGFRRPETCIQIDTRDDN